MSFSSYQEIKFLIRKLKDTSPQILKILQICVSKLMHPQTADHCRSIQYILHNWCMRLLKHKNDKTHFASYSLNRENVELAKCKKVASDATIVTWN